MAHLTPEQRLREAALVEQMLEIADRVACGSISPERASDWARSLPALHGSHGTAFRSPLANDLQMCLIGGAPYRAQDVRELARQVRVGECTAPVGILCALKLTSSHIAEMLRVVPYITFVDGIGFFEIAQFGSRVSGRSFLARSLYESHAGRDLTPGSEIATWGIPDAPAERVVVLQDLFDTLAIDDADCVDPPTVPLPRWTLMRQDDNGNVVEIGKYTGYRKAHARVDELTRGGHKQTYWLTDPTPT